MSMSEHNEKRLKKLLGAICEHCAEDGYCILKEITLANNTSERFLIQCKCVEIFKLDESTKDGRDIGWKEAWNRWVDYGYAAKFAQVYDPNPELSYKEVYSKIVS